MLIFKTLYYGIVVDSPRIVCSLKFEVVNRPAVQVKCCPSMQAELQTVNYKLQTEHVFKNCFCFSD